MIWLSLWKEADLDDNRIRDIDPSDPWYDYYYYSNVLKRSKGVFLKRVTRKIHGILFLRGALVSGIHGQRDMPSTFLPYQNLIQYP